MPLQAKIVGKLAGIRNRRGLATGGPMPEELLSNWPSVPERAARLA